MSGGPASDLSPATIDLDVCTVDEARRVRRQENGRRRDFVGSANPSKRNLCRHPGHHGCQGDGIWGGSSETGCFYRARADDVDPDLAALQINDPVPRKAADCSLGCCVDAAASQTLERNRRRHQDDGAAVGHQREGLLHREDKAFHIDGEQAVEVLFGYLADRGMLQDARVRNDDVDPTLICLDGFVDPIEISETGRVCLDGGDVASDFLYRLVQFFLSTPGDKSLTRIVSAMSLAALHWKT